MDNKIGITIYVPVRYAHQALDKIEAVLKSVDAKVSVDHGTNAPARPKADRAAVSTAQRAGSKTLVGTVTDIDAEYKTGTGRKGRWTLGMVEIDVDGYEWPVKATTFDEVIREKLGIIDVGELVTISYEQGDKGKKLLDISAA